MKQARIVDTNVDECSFGAGFENLVCRRLVTIFSDPKGFVKPQVFQYQGWCSTAVR